MLLCCSIILREPLQKIDNAVLDALYSGVCAGDAQQGLVQGLGYVLLVSLAPHRSCESERIRSIEVLCFVDGDQPSRVHVTEGTASVGVNSKVKVPIVRRQLIRQPYDAQCSSYSAF